MDSANSYIGTVANPLVAVDCTLNASFCSTRSELTDNYLQSRKRSSSSSWYDLLCERA
jgi:hypothetical protein